MEEALELVRTKDTKERMAGVEHLHQLLEASRKPLSSSEVTSLVDACLDLLKDNNFRVSQGALQALASATVLAGDHLKIHFNALVPAAVERLGDAKQPVRDAARRLLLTLMEVSSPTIIVERAGSYAWEHKSWRVREEFARTVTSAISLFASTELPLQRAILPPILQMLNDPNHVVREAATACIEEMYRQMGSQFREELQRHQLPSYMVKDINARLERIEPKVRSSNDRNNLGSASEHKHVNLGSKKSSHKPKHPSLETLLSGGDSDVTAKPVEPINVYSEKELITEFEKIASTLVPEKDGSIRIAAMQRLEGLVIGGATDYPSFCGLLKRLVCPLSMQLADGRSTVVKQACHLLKVLSMELLGDFESCAEIFIPVLFKLVVITVLVIAESADNCIKMMLRNCKVARILPRIAYSAKNDRSAVLRARCCEYALVILEHWPDAPEIQRSADIYEDLIKCCVGDAMSEVSSTARTCSRLFAKTWPERSMGLFQSFDPVIQRIVNEEDGGLHRRHASPSVHERNVSHTPLTSAPLNLPGYGTSTIVAMEKTSSLSSRASLSSGLLSSQAKQQSKGTDCSLESVLHSSKQKVTAIESLLRGLDLSERHKFSNLQSSSLDLGIDPPSSRDPSVPFAVTASNEFANLSLDAKLSAVNDGNSCNGDLANCVLKGPTSCLIAQDTSKDFESRHDSPNVVAKLMGLDAPSHQQELYDLAHGSRNPQFHFDASYSEIPSGYWHQEDGFVDGEIDCGVHQCQEEHNCKDTYEMWQLSLNTNYLRNLPLQKGRCSENANEQKMALIHRKFMDAKRLSTDENSCQTKEFQDAVDVLSSNQNLFLKVFQESNSLISHHLYERQPIPLLNETKRITVLKPSKMVFNDKFPASGNRNEKQVRKSCPRNHFGLSPVASTRRVGESSTQTPTRIVVLKPTPGLIQDVMAAIPSITSSPTNLRRPKFFEVPREDEIQEAREVAKEITQQMRENLSGHQRNETILSSVLSCGYTGDESSFNKSEAEFEGKHSWDYINPNGDPYSSSSLSHASYTPESSVTKEAKKRLSERWAVMASNGTCSEQRHVRRSASTLGEMLALSDIKKLEMFEVDDIKRDQDHRVSTSCLISNADGVEIESPRSLLRSKSLPVNSLASNQRLGDESLDREARKIDGSTKQGTKSSFRGKVTSLFFQRSKKLDKGKTDKSQYQDKVVSNYIEASVPCGMPCDNNLEYSRPEEFQSSDLQSANRTLWCKLNDEPRQRLSLEQVPWSTSKPATPGTSSEIQDQPSPISVLESPFEENGIVPNQLGKQPAFSLGRSNLIDKSPPIGSIARTLSWDESSAQPGTSNSLKLPFLFGGSHKEADWLFLIQSLLSAAGVEKEAKLHTNPSGWHSPDSPLNPLLREKYVNSIYKEPLYKANRRQLRSNCLLVFDCVNGALVELSGMGSNATKRIIEKRAEITPSGEMLTDRIWAKLMHSFMRSDWKAKDGGDNNSVVVECLVHKELAGKGWEDLMMVEIDIIGKEIEEKLLEELVEDSISGWTGKMMGLKKHRN